MRKHTGVQSVMPRENDLNFYAHTDLVMIGVRHEEQVNHEITKSPRRLKRQIQHPCCQSRDKDTKPSKQKKSKAEEERKLLYYK
jgi:hypothetical protein